ncbi:MAG: hypothetical protein Q4G67_05165 [Actinomycetia bacterium]|nr:hypothetical protein [Actinomycetes bacterium]
MTDLARTISARTTGLLAAGTLAALLVTGCTGNGDTGDTDGSDAPTTAVSEPGSTGAGADPTTEANEPTEEPTQIEPTDRSAEILAFTMDAEPVAEATATWHLAHEEREVTLQVFAVEAYPLTTRLVYTLFPNDVAGFPNGVERYWADFPRLVDVANDEALYVTRYDQVEGPRDVRGNYSDMSGNRTDLPPMTAQYPALTEGISEISIEMTGMEPLTVPVTWPHTLTAPRGGQGAR